MMPMAITKIRVQLTVLAVVLSADFIDCCGRVLFTRRFLVFAM
jgi:lipid-A-disaccharide synthase-like uncharacterized protein